MHQLAKQGLFLSIAVLLAACHPIYGLSREAELPAPPPFACIRKTLQDLPKVTSVRYEINNSPKDRTCFSFSSINPCHPSVHNFFYTIGEELVILQIYIYPNQPNTFAHRLMQMHIPPPQERINTVRPVMIMVEQAFERQCDMKNLTTTIEESCIGVRCE